jgi:hypothetical protein
LSGNASEDGCPFSWRFVSLEEREGNSRRDGMDTHLNEQSEFTDDPRAWRQFYEDLDLKIVGVLSKGSNSRLSFAVISAEGSKLYAFVRESATGHLEESTQLDDA